MTNRRINQASPDQPGQSRRERGRLHQRLHANPALSLTTKVIITTVGSLVLGAGVVMMVTPGPGIVGIILGLAILASEYEWADRWLVKAKEKAHEARVRAEQMDPRVRRRRILLALLMFVVVVGGVAVYVIAFGWPTLAVSGWNWVQGLGGWVPDLPGM